MARPAPPDLSHLVDRNEIAVRVTPKASRDAIVDEGDILRVSVAAPPDRGKANEAVRALLSKALGLPRSRLTLIRGATSRDKRFRLDPPR